MFKCVSVRWTWAWYFWRRDTWNDCQLTHRLPKISFWWCSCKSDSLRKTNQWMNSLWNVSYAIKVINCLSARQFGRDLKGVLPRVKEQWPLRESNPFQTRGVLVVLLSVFFFSKSPHYKWQRRTCGSIPLSRYVESANRVDTCCYLSHPFNFVSANLFVLLLSLLKTGFFQPKIVEISQHIEVLITYDANIWQPLISQ